MSSLFIHSMLGLSPSPGLEASPCLQELKDKAANAQSQTASAAMAKTQVNDTKQQMKDLEGKLAEGKQKIDAVKATLDPTGQKALEVEVPVKS